jgi:hypothetical protein
MTPARPVEKMGGQPRLRLLAQDSPDVRDSLLGVGAVEPASSRLDQAIRERYDGRYTAEVVLDADLAWRLQTVALGLESVDAEPAHGQGSAPGGSPPAALRGADVVVLSGQTMLTEPWWRHRASGQLVTPPRDWNRSGKEPRQAWLRAHCRPVDAPAVGELSACLRGMTAAAKDQVGAHLLFYNCSPIDPSDQVFNYYRRPETMVERIRKLNLTLLKLSMETGISIIDVERVVAELGAAEVPTRLRYTDRAAEAIRDEVVRVLDDIGFFELRPLLMQIGSRAG